MISKKICTVGSYSVGKTSLVKRFVESIFDERYLTTVGVKIDKKQLSVDGQDVNLMIWDLVGEDELAQLKLSNLRGASGYVLVADGCRNPTFEKALELHERITQTQGSIPFVLVLNKADLKENWEVDPAAVEKLRGEGWTVIETSAKTGANVEQMFRSLTGMMLKAKPSAAAGTN